MSEPKRPPGRPTLEPGVRREQIATYAPKALVAQLTAVANTLGISRSEAIVQAMREWLEKRLN